MDLSHFVEQHYNADKTQKFSDFCDNRNQQL